LLNYKEIGLKEANFFLNLGAAVHLVYFVRKAKTRARYMQSNKHGAQRVKLLN